MAKNDYIHNTINVFREKLDNALKGDNAGTEILQAVQELLSEINAKYPQASFQPEMIAEKKTPKHTAAGKTANTENYIPEGVQYMLKNIAAYKQD